jgi:hypothetical protein
MFPGGNIRAFWTPNGNAAPRQPGREDWHTFCSEYAQWDRVTLDGYDHTCVAAGVVTATYSTVSRTVTSMRYGPSTISMRRERCRSPSAFSAARPKRKT